MIKNIYEIFDINSNAVISVIGCNGKTTWMNTFAEKFPGKRILITTTTKIRAIEDPHVYLCTTLDQCLNHNPKAGVTCMGIQDQITGKFSSMPIDVLEQVSKKFDFVLIEADGSKTRPCKGWLKTEPVIPHFTTHTVGIVTLNGLNKKANTDTVLRIPEFLNITGLNENETITLDAIKNMVCHPEGMFYNCIGKRLIFVNQVESADKAILAKDLLSRIRNNNPNFFNNLFYGSAIKQEWTEVF